MHLHTAVLCQAVLCIYLPYDYIMLKTMSFNYCYYVSKVTFGNTIVLCKFIYLCYVHVYSYFTCIYLLSAVSCAGWVAQGMTVAGPVRINMQPVNLYAPPVLVNCDYGTNVSAGPVVTVIRK